MSRTLNGPTSADLESGWHLVDRGTTGVHPSLLIGEAQLRHAYPGITIGRHPALCELVVSDESVSRRHARLSLDGDALVVEDLNSLNGTALDGRELRPFELVAVSANQILTIGATAFTIERVEARSTAHKPSQHVDADAPHRVTDIRAGLEVHDESGRLIYSGQRQPLLKLAAISIFLTFITSGLYYFWARKRIHQYIWKNLYFCGSPLSYIGTGRALLVDGLTACVLLLCVAGATVAIIALTWGRPPLALAAGVFTVIAVTSLMQAVRVTDVHYTLTHTAWRGVPLRSTASTVAYVMRSQAWLAAVLITFGVAYPWMRMAQHRYHIEHCWYGAGRFHIRASTGPLLKSWIMVLLALAIPFVGLLAIETDLMSTLVDKTFFATVARSVISSETATLPAITTWSAIWLLIFTPITIVAYIWYRTNEWRTIVNGLHFVVDGGGYEAKASSRARFGPVLSAGILAGLTSVILIASLVSAIYLIAGPKIFDQYSNYILEAIVIIAFLFLIGCFLFRAIFVGVVIPHLTQTTRFDTRTPFDFAVPSADGTELSMANNDAIQGLNNAPDQS